MNKLIISKRGRIGTIAWIAALGIAVSARSIDKEITEPLVENLPGFFCPHSMPTKPVPVTRGIAEWEPAQMLLVSIPLENTLKDPRVFAFYYSLIEAASRYVDVGILQGINGERSTGRFIKRLSDEGLSEASLSRVHFLPSQADQYWLRDFGPIFARKDDGSLVAIDTIYRSLSNEKEVWDAAATDIDSKYEINDIEAFQEYSTNQRRCEVTPMYVAKFLRQHYQFDCDLVRPPLYLQGGDYITDGAGRFFVSEDTLLENGGRINNLDRIFAAYFGAKELFVLNALPGVAAKHLDLLICHPKPNTFIMTDAPAMREGANLPYRRILTQVQQAQQANKDYLLRNLPNAEIYTVPMPPLVVEDTKRVKIKARAQIFAYACEEIGIDYLRYNQLPSGSAQRRLVQKQVEEHVAKQCGRPINLKEDADLSLAASKYIGMDLDALIETNVDAGTVYRSYVNSLQIVVEGKPKVWLLPRYRPRAGENEEVFIAMEKEVERVYRLIDPEAILHWIDADVMSESLGAIHCVAMTLPRSSALVNASTHLDTINGNPNRHESNLKQR